MDSKSKQGDAASEKLKKKSSRQKVDALPANLLPKFPSERNANEIKESPVAEPKSPMKPVDELDDELIQISQQTTPVKSKESVLQEEDTQCDEEPQSAEIYKKEQTSPVVECQTPEQNSQKKEKSEFVEQPSNFKKDKVVEVVEQQSLDAKSKFAKSGRGERMKKKKKGKNSKSLEEQLNSKKTPKLKVKKESKPADKPAIPKVMSPTKAPDFVAKSSYFEEKANEAKSKFAKRDVPSNRPKAATHLDESKQKKKKIGFLKNVYNMTKFWGRKSDCVVNPSMEMLAKSYVVPEYGTQYTSDFLPDPKNLFTNDEDYKLRLKNNCSHKDELFLNNRPFWLTRTAADTTPKARIQNHRMIKQVHAGNPSTILARISHRDQFYNPQKDSVEKMMAVDKTAFILDPSDANKKSEEPKEAKRVCANTFHATLMFEVDKISWNEEQKKLEGKKSKEKSHDRCMSGKRVTFNAPQQTVLHSYRRKARPSVTKVKRRDFQPCDYKAGERKPPKKTPKVTTASTNSTTSDSKKSKSKE